MRTFEMPAGPPRERGRAHGEEFRGEIGSLAEIRLYLCAQMSGGTREQILAVAARHVPVLRAYHPALCEEMLGVADGAALSPSMAVVLNHYTDLRDLEMGERGGATVDGCSTIYARTPSGPVAGQTWDMHASSMPFVLLLRVPPGDRDAPAAWILTLTGCLALAGMNARGVAVCINNLPATDARVGPVWPAVVRSALEQPTAAAARDALLATQHASGRHFLVAGPDGAFAIETTATRRAVVYAGESPDYVHTNHCVDPEVGACTRVDPAATTFDRYRFLRASLDRAPLAGPVDAWRLLGSTEGYPRSVCQNQATPENPHGPATCGGIVMSPGTGEILACAGLTHAATPEPFRI